jgi:thiol-disulfide isomerase/thioredoxin
MTTWRSLASSLPLILLGAAVGCSSPAPQGPPSLAVIGEAAPDLQLAWLDGSPAGNLESLRGRVVLLEFWRTWCSPCLSQVPRLNALAERYEADGLAVVAVTNEEEELVRATALEVGMTFPVALTPGAEADDAYGIRAVPRAFLIDRHGLLVWAGHPSTLEDERVRSLLAQR